MMSKVKDLPRPFPQRAGDPHVGEAGKAPCAPGDKPGPRKPAREQAEPATARAYLWVFVVTFSIHELSNKGLILVHLGQAHPTEGRSMRLLLQ